MDRLSKAAEKRQFNQTFAESLHSPTLPNNSLLLTYKYVLAKKLRVKEKSSRTKYFPQ